MTIFRPVPSRCKTLLDAQEAVLASENSLSAMQYRYLNATMQLWLALGGNEAFASGLEYQGFHTLAILALAVAMQR
ncbi:hypothetical protein ISX56_34895, partial [Serratia ureilytica]|nr:hypothetical protein [Serratia ureilytica]